MKPLHSGDQIALGHLHHQMKVILHETIGLHLPISFRARLRQRGDKQLPIPVIVEDGFPPVATIHQVVNRAGILQFGACVPCAEACPNRATVSICGTDPFSWFVGRFRAKRFVVWRSKGELRTSTRRDAAGGS